MVGKEKLESEILRWNIILVLVTAISVIITWCILNQQRREELIQNRAYIVVDEITIEENTNKDESLMEFRIKAEIKNLGGTPATQVYVLNHFFYDDKIREELRSPETGYFYLAPGQSSFVDFFVTKYMLDKIGKENNNFFIIDVYYEDYQKNKYHYFNHLKTNVKNSHRTFSTFLEGEERVKE